MRQHHRPDPTLTAEENGEKEGKLLDFIDNMGFKTQGFSLAVMGVALGSAFHPGNRVMSLASEDPFRGEPGVEHQIIYRTVQKSQE